MEEEEGEEGGGSKREGRLASAVKEGQDHLVLRLLQAGVPLDGLDSEGVSLDSIELICVWIYTKKKKDMAG